MASKQWLSVAETRWKENKRTKWTFYCEIEYKKATGRANSYFEEQDGEGIELMGEIYL